MIGLLNINKPAGVTSRDVVNRVQRVVRPAKIGHAGTLDPLATGVLVLCIGKATRLIPYVQQMRKRYRGTFLLGRLSETEDVEGDVVELESPPEPTAEELRKVLPDFSGEIQQRPPAFSALKVNGKRAYDLARKGEVVELAARPIMIHGLELIEYEYPRFVLDIECGSGTYVRSLGRDIAVKLGTAAVMSDLIRTGIGRFCIQEAISTDQVSKESIESQLIPPLHALGGLPKVRLNDDEARRIAAGLTIENRFDIPDAESQSDDRIEFAAVDGDDKLLAILVHRKGGLGPVRNFVEQ